MNKVEFSASIKPNYNKPASTATSLAFAAIFATSETKPADSRERAPCAKLSLPPPRTDAAAQAAAAARGADRQLAKVVEDGEPAEECVGRAALRRLSEGLVAARAFQLVLVRRGPARYHEGAARGARVRFHTETVNTFF